MSCAGDARAARGLLALVLVVVLAAALATVQTGCGAGTGSAVHVGDAALGRAFRDQLSGLEVQDRGVVESLLPDDVQGSRHQRFILRLASGQTLLVAHDIDIAPRVPGLHVGDEVEFRGVYEWNAEGGVVHWTHHDPQGGHAAGWLRHDGHTYQ